MLFGEHKRPISDFLPRILAHIDGADSDMVATYVMDSVIQFLRDTKIYTELVCLELDCCLSSYHIPTDNRVTEVISARFITEGGHTLPAGKVPYRLVGNTLYIGATPFLLDRAELEVAVAPNRDSDSVPDFLYEEWVEPITLLTLMKLYLLTDAEWYNPAAAEANLSLYQQFVRQARFSKMTKHKAFNMRLSNMRK